jgi:hypothetical protein
MTSHPDSEPDWGSQYRLIAREKWKAKSAARGQPVTDALVEYAQPQSAAVPLRLMWERVPAEKWAEIHAEVNTAIRQYSDGEKIAFGVSVVLAWGRK